MCFLSGVLKLSVNSDRHWSIGIWVQTVKRGLERGLKRELLSSNASYNTRCEVVSAIYLSRTRYSQRHQISEPMGAIHLRSRGEQPWTVLRAEYEVYCLRHISESHLNLLRIQVHLLQLSCKFIHRLKLDTLHAKAHLGAEPPTSVILTWSSIQ